MTNKNEKKDSSIKWLVKIFFITFILSLIFNYASTEVIANIDMIPSIFILALIIITGVISDMLATAVTAADEAPFHAKAADKKKGAKQSVKLVKNAEKVSNFCGDVVGDICGVLSGAVSALVAVGIASKLGIENINFVSIFVAAMVAALTVLGKGIGKNIGISRANDVVYGLGCMIDFFTTVRK